MNRLSWSGENERNEPTHKMRGHLGREIRLKNLLQMALFMSTVGSRAARRSLYSPRAKET